MQKYNSMDTIGQSAIHGKSVCVNEEIKMSAQVRMYVMQFFTMVLYSFNSAYALMHLIAHCSLHHFLTQEQISYPEMIDSCFVSVLCCPYIISV